MRIVDYDWEGFRIYFIEGKRGVEKILNKFDNYS